MRRLVLPVLLPAALAFLCCSCSAPQPDKGGGQRQRTIGVTLLTRGHLFYRDLEQGLQDEATKSGYKLVVTSAEFDLGKQAAQIEDFVARKVDAIVTVKAEP